MSHCRRSALTESYPQGGMLSCASIHAMQSLYMRHCFDVLRCPPLPACLLTCPPACLCEQPTPPCLSCKTSVTRCWAPLSSQSRSMQRRAQPPSATTRRCHSPRTAAVVQMMTGTWQEGRLQQAVATTAAAAAKAAAKRSRSRREQSSRHVRAGMRETPFVCVPRIPSVRPMCAATL